MSLKSSRNQLKSTHQNLPQQKPLTKRDLMNKILNNQIQVIHSLEDQILRKKILKCYVHGSIRKIQPSSQSKSKTPNFQTHKLLEKNDQVLNLGIEAPSIIGKKNVMFLKSQKSSTRHRSTSATQINLVNLRNCCHFRGNSQFPRSNTLPVRRMFQLRQNFPKVSGTNIMTSIIIPWNSQRDEPIDESTIFARSRMYQTTSNIRIKRNNLN